MVFFEESLAGFGFFLPEVVGDEAVAQAAPQLAVGGAAVAGELVDAEVFVEILEVVFLDPAVEHEVDDFPGGSAVEVAAEDG